MHVCPHVAVKQYYLQEEVKDVANCVNMHMPNRACEKFYLKQHIRKSQDLQKFHSPDVFKYVSVFFVLKKIPNDFDYSRIAIITSKKVGCAVERNWARRIIREIFRKKIQNYYGTYDFLIIVRQAMISAKFEEICNQFIESVKSPIFP